MNKKLIAAAVSAAIVAPVAAYGEITVYGRINNAIDLNDLAEDGDSTTDLTGVSSRFGIKYNKEIGNGLSAHGRYEFAVSTDREGKRSFDRSDSTSNDTAGVDDIRIATVGFSGPFGRIDAGQQWSSYFNTFGTLISPTYSLGYYVYSSIGGGPFRASNTIKYSNSFGPLYAELDVRLNESNESADNAEKIRGDGIGLGLSWAVTDNITIAAAFDSEDGVDDQSLQAGVAPAAGAAPTTAQFNGSMADWDNNPLTAVTAPPAALQTAYAAFADIANGPTAAQQRIDYLAELAADTEGVGAGDLDSYTAAKNGTIRSDADLPDTNRVGIAVKANFGGYWLSVGWQNYEVDDNDRTGADDEVDIDTTFIYGGGNFGEKTNWLIGYSEADDGRSASARVYPLLDADGNTAGNQPRYGADAVAETDDSEQLTWGVYHNLGGGIKIYYEATDVDSENAGNDGARHFIGMRVDF